MKKNILVTGASGFIGGHLCKRLKGEGHTVTGVDIKLPEYWDTNDICTFFYQGDLRIPYNVDSLFSNDAGDVYDEVYNLACNMGGAAFIFTGEHDADIMHDNALININVAKACVKYKAKRLFYSSSACIYNQDLQGDPDNPGMKESTAWPLNPDSDYGIEKAFSERLYKAFERNYGLEVRIARFHNIFGPYGTYQGGREKAPAAICRKVAEVTEAIEFVPGPCKKLTWVMENGNTVIDIVKKDFVVTHPPIYSELNKLLNYSNTADTLILGQHLDFFIPGSIDIWGDGQQTRSFLYIDECIEGVLRLMHSDCKEIVNIGSNEMITINDLAKMVIRISGKNLTVNNIPGPTGVRGRNSQNDLIEKELGWKPTRLLEEGMKVTYDWIASQVKKV